MTGRPRLLAPSLLALIWLSLGLCPEASHSAQNRPRVDPPGLQATLTYPPNFRLARVPNPLSAANPGHPLVPRARPEVGVSFRDNYFQTILTRVTGIGALRHQYSRFDPFNRNQSRIILHDTAGGDYIVFRTGSLPYERSANRVRTLTGLAEPRWDPVEADLAWGLRDFSLIRVNSATGAETVIKNFSRDSRLGPIIAAEPDLYRITRREEGEASRDNRYWAFGLQGTRDDYRLRYIFTWDRQQDRVIGLRRLLPAESEIDWVGMSYLGNFVLIGGDYNNGGNLAGLTMANRELTRFHRLDYSIGHADIGLDSQGREVVVMQNVRTDYIDLIPVDWATRPILVAGGSYQGTNRTRLVQLFYSSDAPNGFSAGVHISCNAPGYAVISTHLEPGVAERNWLDRANILVKLSRTDPRAYYLSKVYNTTQEYWEETHGAISNDGTKVVWASNWGQNVGSERVFVVQLDMPPNWQRSLQ